jgi:predicted 2-oxoglutarate/Fe(II)-dependent dioxygenase YbiX
MNKPALFDLACRITGCPKIASFIGRLHRTTAASDQHIDWHHDAVESRTLGICVNLSMEDYTGGVLQIRDPNRRLRAEVGRAAAGDAFFFRIDADWQHRLTRVESGRRTVGVGWFRTSPARRQHSTGISAISPIMLR